MNKSKAFIQTILLCLLTSMFSTHSSFAKDRVLNLYNIHTKENLSVVYKTNNRYNQSALKKLNYFLRDWRRNEPTKMDPALFDLLWEVTKEVGATGKTIHVFSGYRSKKTNDALRRRGRKTARTSQHINGKAIDFKISGVSPSKVRAAALKKHAGGVGHYANFSHLDTGSVRHWPRMSRSQLNKVFPKGQTIHVPTDGKPLNGYSLAMAMHKKGKLNSVGKTKDEIQKSGNLFAKLFGLAGKKNPPIVPIIEPVGEDLDIEELSAETIIARASQKAKQAKANTQIASNEAQKRPLILTSMPKARPAYENDAEIRTRLARQQDSKAMALLAMAPISTNDELAATPLKEVEASKKLLSLAELNRSSLVNLPKSHPDRKDKYQQQLMMTAPNFAALEIDPSNNIALGYNQNEIKLSTQTQNASSLAQFSEIEKSKTRASLAINKANILLKSTRTLREMSSLRQKMRAQN